MVTRRHALWAPMSPSRNPVTALRSARYFAQHASIAIPALIVHAMAAARKRDIEPVAVESLDAIRTRYRALLETDVKQAHDGAYPWSLLFDWPLRDYASAAPGVLRDFLTLDTRRQKREWKLQEDDANEFPKYYRRQYHWQKGGYLTERSAKLYDLGVELLFIGGADVMRRQVIPPMTAAYRHHPRPRVLDVACGTGHTLAQIKTALPNAELSGIDLSPAYVAKAKAMCPEAAILTDDARALPFVDDTFDIVTSTYLFHEVPEADRRTVLAELARVVKPGGLVVLQDSAQLDDAPELAPFLHAFGREMHEPYYDNYLNDPLPGLLEGAGLRLEGERSDYLARTVWATAV